MLDEGAGRMKLERRDARRETRDLKLEVSECRRKISSRIGFGSSAIRPSSRVACLVSRVPHHGFTLIELIMVIVIIGILSVIAHSRFTAYYGLKVDGAARKLAADIRYAQQVSLSQHEAHEIEFDTANNRYRLYVVSTSTNATDPLTRETGTVGQDWTSGYVVEYDTDPEFLGIDLTSASFGSTVKLRFSSLGTPQNGSGTVLSATGSATLSLQGYSRTVEVTPNTGQVEVQ